MTILNDVTVRNGARFFTATVDGVTYEIPEMWSIGYCTTHGGSAIEAARAWHEQALMEEQFSRQQIRLGTRVEVSKRASCWYAGRVGTVVAIREADCTRRYSVRLDDETVHPSFRFDRSELVVGHD